jgi:hypothetical protein
MIRRLVPAIVPAFSVAGVTTDTPCALTERQSQSTSPHGPFRYGRSDLTVETEPYRNLGSFVYSTELTSQRDCYNSRNARSSAMTWQGFLDYRLHVKFVLGDHFAHLAERTNPFTGCGKPALTQSLGRAHPTRIDQYTLLRSFRGQSVNIRLLVSPLNYRRIGIG